MCGGSLDPEVLPVQIEVPPPQRAQLAAAQTGDHRQPEQEPPLGVGPGVVEQVGRLACRRRVGPGLARRRRLRQLRGVHAHVAPSGRPAERTPQHIVDLPGRARAQRGADVTAWRPAAAHRLAPVQPGVEAFEQLGVEPAGLQVAERRDDVEPDQVLVPLPGRDLEVGDLHPLLHRGRDGDRRLRVPVLVDLPLQPGQRLLRLDAGRAGLADVWRRGSAGRSRRRRRPGSCPRAAARCSREGGEGGEAQMHHRCARSHDSSHEPALWIKSLENAAGQQRCPQRDSNPCYRLERAASWATRRWGRAGFQVSGARNRAADARGRGVALPVGLGAVAARAAGGAREGRAGQEQSQSGQDDHVTPRSSKPQLPHRDRMSRLAAWRRRGRSCGASWTGCSAAAGSAGCSGSGWWTGGPGARRSSCGRPQRSRTSPDPCTVACSTRWPTRRSRSPATRTGGCASRST